MECALSPALLFWSRSIKGRGRLQERILSNWWPHILKQPADGQQGLCFFGKKRRRYCSPFFMLTCVATRIASTCIQLIGSRHQTRPKLSRLFVQLNKSRRQTRPKSSRLFVQLDASRHQTRPKSSRLFAQLNESRRQTRSKSNRLLDVHTTPP